MKETERKEKVEMMKADERKTINERGGGGGGRDGEKRLFLKKKKRDKVRGPRRERGKGGTAIRHGFS